MPDPHDDPEEDLDLDDYNEDCMAMGCDIREGDIECRRCGAEVIYDDDEE